MLRNDKTFSCIGFRLLTFLVSAGPILTWSTGCPAPTEPPGDMPAGDPAGDDPTQPGDPSGGGDPSDNGNEPSDSDGGGATGAVPSGFTGNELFVEGTDFAGTDGSARRSQERFTSTFSLTVLDSEVSQAFLGGVLVDVISGNLRGQAHLTYSESGSDVGAVGSECLTFSYSGQTEWDVTVEGSYRFIPALDEISVLIPDRDHSSPQYPVTYTAPGCPELESTGFSSYYWGGPGIGTWGGVSIQLRGGSFDSGLDNVLGNDLGEEDFYEIHVEVQP